MIEEFARLLYKVIGLDPQSIGMSSIERAVRQRVEASGAPSHDAYLALLRTTPSEVQALIEAIVVPETWFFRDPKAFTVVAERARQTTKAGKLHFLCVPCSTGEEPYSLAMALLEAGLDPGQFHIDAMDVSERVLAIARKGFYGRNSFRGTDLGFRDRFFQSTPDGHLLDPAVRQLVHFHHGNLFDDSSLVRGQIYDAIFCRNLLIYFDGETQRRAILALERLLVPHGLFCVGPAETGLLAAYPFTHTRVPLAFAFRQGKPEAPPPAPAAKTREFTLLAPPLPRPKRVSSLSDHAGATAVPDLAEAARFADEGRFAEVTAICRAHLQQAGATAHAHYLLALVSDATEHVDEAIAHYRKALYLDPQHHDALLHFSILSAKRGDMVAAEALRRRARRTSEKAA